MSSKSITKFFKLTNFNLLLIFFVATSTFVNAQSNTRTNYTNPFVEIMIILFSIQLTCIFYLTVFTPSAVVAAWIYKDAKKLKVEYPLLWSLLSFFFFPIVFIIYYLAIRKEAKQKLDKVSE